MGVACLPCLCGLLLLPGCLVQRLWQADLRGDVAVGIDAAEFEVTSLALSERSDAEAQRGTAPARELVVQAVQRDGRRGAETAWMVTEQPTFALRPYDAGAPELVAALLQGCVGSVDRCDLDVDWYTGIDTEPHFTACLRLEGWLSPRLLHAQVDAATAQALLGSPAALPIDADDREQQRQLAAVDRVDWRVLCPQLAAGSGIGIGCFGSKDGDGVDVLVQAGEPERPSYLLVPVAALPLLAGIHRRHDTMLPRFCCEQRFLPVLRAGAAPGSRPLPLPGATAMVLQTHLRRQVDWARLGVKEVLTPFAAVGDAAIWLVRHSQLAPLFEPQPKPEPPIAPPRGSR